MLLKNATTSIQQFGLGSTLGGESRFIQIPAMATVELDDKDWKAITSSLTRVQVYEDTEEPIGTEEFGQAKIGKDFLYKSVKVPTGRFHKVNLTLEMVKAGRLIIVKAPESGLTVAQLVKRINLVKGMSVDDKDFTQEELEAVYLENEVKIKAAIVAAKAVATGELKA